MQYQSFGTPFPILRLNPRKWINDASDPDYPAYSAWVKSGEQSVPSYSAAAPPSIVQLAESDFHMARIGEDVLNALVAKGVLKLTDLPPVVQSLIAQRQSLRAQIAKE